MISLKEMFKKEQEYLKNKEQWTIKYLKWNIQQEEYIAEKQVS